MYLYILTLLCCLLWSLLYWCAWSCILFFVNIIRNTVNSASNSVNSMVWVWCSYKRVIRIATSTWVRTGSGDYKAGCQTGTAVAISAWLRRRWRDDEDTEQSTMHCSVHHRSTVSRVCTVLFFLSVGRDGMGTQGGEKGVGRRSVVGKITTKLPTLSPPKQVPKVVWKEK